MADKDTLMEDSLHRGRQERKMLPRIWSASSRRSWPRPPYPTEYDDALGNEQAAAEDAETAFRVRAGRDCGRAIALKTRMRAVRLANLRPVR